MSFVQIFPEAGTECSICFSDSPATFFGHKGGGRDRHPIHKGCLMQTVITQQGITGSNLPIHCPSCRVFPILAIGEEAIPLSPYFYHAVDRRDTLRDLRYEVAVLSLREEEGLSRNARYAAELFREVVLDHFAPRVPQQLAQSELAALFVERTEGLSDDPFALRLLWEIEQDGTASPVARLTARLSLVIMYLERRGGLASDEEARALSQLSSDTRK